MEPDIVHSTSGPSRHLAKNINFGALYGMSRKSIKKWIEKKGTDQEKVTPLQEFIEGVFPEEAAELRKQQEALRRERRAALANHLRHHIFGGESRDLHVRVAEALHRLPRAAEKTPYRHDRKPYE